MLILKIWLQQQQIMFEGVRNKALFKEGDTEYINSVNFNSDYSCIALATNKGFKVFATQPLKLKQHRDLGAPLQLVQMYERTNLLALVGFDHAAFKSTRVALFDDKQNVIIADATFESHVLSVKIRISKVAVALRNRVYLLNLSNFQIEHVIPTIILPEEQSYSLLSLSDNQESFFMACPGLDIGEVLLVNMEEETQRRIRAHQSNLKIIVMFMKGDKIATVSEKGMNIRIFSTQTGQQIQEVRRGNQYGHVYSLAFSRYGNWLTCTSDSNTVHVFACKLTPNERTRKYISQKDPVENPKSKLYFMRRIMPYYDAEYSYSRFVMPDFESEMESYACFGVFDDDLVVINDYGSYKRLTLAKGSLTVIDQEKQLLDMTIKKQK